MKTVLVLVLSCQLKPYDVMAQTSLDTWDKPEVEGVDTVYYFGNPTKPNTTKFIYFPINEGYFNMGHKLLSAFDWCLKNKQFDYIARVNSSCYVRKDKLIEYCQGLPEINLFSGIEVAADEKRAKWMFGGGQFIYSKDVVENIVKNKSEWNHQEIEDVSISHLANYLNIPYHEGKFCSINKRENDWLLLDYPKGDNLSFKEFSEIKNVNQFFYRVKCDGNRNVDKIVMNELFNLYK